MLLCCGRHWKIGYTHSFLVINYSLVGKWSMLNEFLERKMMLSFNGSLFMGNEKHVCTSV